MSESTVAFGLAIFPPTGILGVGQFVRQQTWKSILGWSQIGVLLFQMLILGLLRMAIVNQAHTTTTQEMIEESDTLYLTIAAITSLLLGFVLYIVGIILTLPSSFKSNQL